MWIVPVVFVLCVMVEEWFRSLWIIRRRECTSSSTSSIAIPSMVQ